MVIIVKSIAIFLIGGGLLVGFFYLVCSIFVLSHYPAIINYIAEQWHYYLSPVAQQELMYHIMTWGLTIVGICIGIVMLGVFILQIAIRDEALKRGK